LNLWELSDFRKGEWDCGWGLGVLLADFVCKGKGKETSLINNQISKCSIDEEFLKV
jgi:hypothetical protein